MGGVGRALKEGGGDEDALPVHNWRQGGVKRHLDEEREGTCMEWRRARTAPSLSSRLPLPPLQLVLQPVLMEETQSRYEYSIFM